MVPEPFFAGASIAAASCSLVASAMTVSSESEIHSVFAIAVPYGHGDFFIFKTVDYKNHSGAASLLTDDRPDGDVTRDKFQSAKERG